MDYDFRLVPNVRVGLGISSFMGILSLLGSAILLAYSAVKLSTRENHIPLQPVTVMFVYWIVCDLMQALSVTFNLRWALKGAVEEGAYCSSQAVLAQIGDSGAALCVIIISMLVLVRVLKPGLINARPARISFALVVITSLLLLIIILVPSTVIGKYFGNTDLWCWIVDRNGSTARLRVGTEYALMWAALATETLVYGFLLLCRLPFCYRRFSIARQFDAISFDAALGMFWYAVAYAIELIPISVIRIRQFQKHHIPHGWDTVALILFGAAGFVNAILFFTTGRRFGFSDGRRRAKSSIAAPDAVALEVV